MKQKLDLTVTLMFCLELSGPWPSVHSDYPMLLADFCRERGILKGWAEGVHILPSLGFEAAGSWACSDASLSTASGGGVGRDCLSSYGNLASA